MKLDHSKALVRLTGADHGVLCTANDERGTDAVPIVFAVVNEYLAFPIDTVKPKSSTQLRRIRNLESDPRATVLVQHWDKNDWSKLWWVRAELTWIHAPSTTDSISLEAALTAKYEQYSDQPFTEIHMFRIERLTGWSAGE